MKKLLISLVFVCCALLFPQTAFAADENHVIRSWHTSVNYRENNVAEVTQNITVDYLRERHGFYLTIPYIIEIEKNIGEEKRVMRYRARIDNIRVNGSNYDTETENDCLILKIGDEDRTVFGEVSYEIFYTIDMGDDRVSDYDEIFFSLLGADNAALVEAYSFDVTFEKPLPDYSLLQIFSGYYGSLNLDGVEYTINENTVSGRALSPIDSGGAVTIYTRLPEGYFVNESAASPIPAYLILGIAVALLLFGVSSRIMQTREKPVETVEFTAPDGISSAEVGYIIDYMSEDKDILSLIIWFADKGYLIIENKEKSLVLKKVKELPLSFPAYSKAFFNALFEKGNVCELENAGAKLFEGLQAAKMQLPNEFNGERRLYQNSGTVLSFLLPVIIAPLFAFGAISMSDATSDGGILCAILGSVMLLISGLVFAFASTQWTFASMGKRTAFILGSLIPLAIGGGLSIICSFAAVTGFAYYASLLFAVCAVGSLLCALLAKPTSYNIEMTGRLLGLKNFIQTAELDRIKMLAAENPQYFYNVLPYAYVFGLTDVWAKQFEGIALPPPVWYSGTWHMSYYNMYWLTRGINHAHTHMAAEFSTESMKSGGKGGTSFGGGGGFSGGGFGGGGSGSW